MGAQLAHRVGGGCRSGEARERRAAWLAGASLGILAAMAGGSPAAAACLGENTASVTCDAINPATAGTLTTSFAGTTVVNVNPGGQIDGGASATVTAAGSLTFNNNDTTFGINSGPSGAVVRHAGLEFIKRLVIDR